MRPPGRPTRSANATLTVLAHPFELATVVILMGAAVRGVLNLGILEFLPTGLAWTYALVTTAGSILTVLGVFGSVDLTGAHERRTAFYRALEKAGLLLLAGSTAALAILYAYGLPLAESWTVTAQFVAIALAAGLRAHAIRKAERILRRQLWRAIRDAEEED